LKFFDKDNPLTEKRENFRPDTGLLEAEQIFVLFIDIAKNADFSNDVKKEEKDLFFDNVITVFFLKSSNS